MELSSIVLVVFFVAAALWYRQEYRWKQRLRFYANLTEPVLVASTFPGDTEVEARAEYHRQMLAAAGHKWGATVEAFPFPDFDAHRPVLPLDYYIELGRFAERLKQERRVYLREIDPKAFSEHVLKQQV